MKTTKINKDSSTTPGSKNNNQKRRSRISRGRNNNDQVTEMLKICLQRVCELQADLQHQQQQFQDPEAEGFEACALETLRFLADQGLPPDHPMVESLTERLLKDRNN